MTTRRTNRQRRGNTAALFGLMLPVLMGSVAMGVDWGAVAVARLQVQAAADAASVAATTDMDNINVASARATAYAAAMRINGVEPTVEETVYGWWDSSTRTFFPNNNHPDKNAVRVRTQAVMPMYFAWILGVDEVTINAESGAGPAVIPRRAPDHVMSLDVTCSMSNYEISQERIAALALLDCVKERSDPSSRGGVAVFTGVDHPIVYDLIEYGASTYDDLYEDVEDIVKCTDAGNPSCRTWTNQAAGLESALTILDAADPPVPDEVGQVVILMSDGSPQAPSGYLYISSGSNAYKSSYAQQYASKPICNQDFYDLEDSGDILFPLQARCGALTTYTYDAGSWNRWWFDGSQRYYTGKRPNSTNLTQWADLAKARAVTGEVDVYTVYYGSSSSGSNFLRDHIRANEGTHSQVVTPSQIQDVFKDVCVQFTGGTAGMLW